jgi:uncharacterized protein YggL (DUF469 family)
MRQTGKGRDDAEILGFSQLGFPVSFSFSSDATQRSIRLTLDAFLYEVLTPNSLECGGGFAGLRFRGFVTQWKASASEADRREVSEWLRRRAEVADFEVGNLSQAWYGVAQSAVQDRGTLAPSDPRWRPEFPGAKRAW